MNLKMQAGHRMAFETKFLSLNISGTKKPFKDFEQGRNIIKGNFSFFLDTFWGNTFVRYIEKVKIGMTGERMTRS